MSFGKSWESTLVNHHHTAGVLLRQTERSSNHGDLEPPFFVAFGMIM